MNGYQVDGSNQFFTATISAGVGGLLCLCYDLMRLARCIKKPSVLGAFCQDIAWWLTATISTYLLLLIRCSGQVRFFAIIGLAVGFVCWRMTVSVAFMKVTKPIADWVIGATRLVKRRILHPLIKKLKIFGGFLLKTLKNILFSVKNLLKHTGLVVYNQLKSWVGMPFKKRSDRNGSS